MHRASQSTCLAVLFIFLVASTGFSQDLPPVPLPQPQIEGGKPLMQALKDRRSRRDFSPEKISPQVLSNLLWAAGGYNRPDKRTAPSAVNWQEIDIYVATQESLYLYDARANALKPILVQDIRALTGRNHYVKDAPINLIYVADTAKMIAYGKEVSESEKLMYSGADTAFIAQNVYLFCASEGLSTVVRGLIDRATLSRVMNLRPEQRIILAQSIGYPPKELSDK